MNNRMRLQIFTPDEIATIYENSLKFLLNKGVKVEYSPLLEILDKKGAQVDFGDFQVRFSRDIIEEARRVVPRSILMAGGDGRHDINITYPREKLYIATATGNVTYLDPESDAYRDADIPYAIRWAQLLEHLEEIDAVFFPFAKDVPVQTADIHALKATLENTTKHIIIQPYSLGSLEYLFELALAVAGSKEAFKKRPIVSMVACALSPFAYKPMDAEAFILAARYGAPIYAASLPASGATAPVTIAGTVQQNAIETMASLTISQLLAPGTPFVANPVAFSLDMRNGRNIIASVEAELCQAANSQFVKEALKVPMAPFGYATDAAGPGVQSALDRLLLGLLVSLAGADIIAEAGQLAAGMISSPIQLIIDDEIASILKRVTAGVNVNEDTLALDEIYNTAPGSGYLQQHHTLRHCRESLVLRLFSHDTLHDWLTSGARDMPERARERYRELKAKMKPIKLSGEVMKELGQIVKRADEKLAK